MPPSHMQIDQSTRDEPSIGFLNQDFPNKSSGCAVNGDDPVAGIH